jgi:hypothetical protein
MILTVDQLREHVATALEDDALRRLLDAAEAAILEVAGPPGQDVTEVVDGRTSRIVLSRPAATIVAVREAGYSEDLLTPDYSLSSPYVLRRENTRRWADRVAVTYTPEHDAATRMAVQVGLIQLDLNYQPGMEQNTAGNWNEMFVNDYEAERQRVLARLMPTRGMVVL